MGRSPCCSKEGLNRGAWTVVEDKILTDYIKLHGEGRWRSLPKKAGLKRCGKSCRLRWLNYLRPDIKRGNISHDEEDLILRLHRLLGNRWSLIAGRLPGRTDNEIKNYWNTNLGKKCADRDSNKNKNKPPPAEAEAATNRPKCLDSSTVIRTKATRCSKVFMTITPPTTTTTPEGNSTGQRPDPAAPSSTTPTHLAETEDFSMDLMAEFFSLEGGDQLWLPDLLDSSNSNGDGKELTCGCSDWGSLEEYWSNLGLGCLQHSSSSHAINITSFPPMPLDHLLTPN